jgi:hypothetical protein
MRKFVKIRIYQFSYFPLIIPIRECELRVKKSLEENETFHFSSILNENEEKNKMKSSKKKIITCV